MESRSQSKFAIFVVDRKAIDHPGPLYLTTNPVPPHKVIQALNNGDFVWRAQLVDPANLIPRAFYSSQQEVDQYIEDITNGNWNLPLGTILVEYKERPDNGIDIVSYKMDNMISHHFERPEYVDLTKLSQKEAEQKKITEERAQRIKGQERNNQERIIRENEMRLRKAHLKEEQAIADSKKFKSLHAAISSTRIGKSNIIAVRSFLADNPAAVHQKNTNNETPLAALMRTILRKAEENNKTEIDNCFAIMNELFQYNARLDLDTEEQKKTWHVIYQFASDSLRLRLPKPVIVVPPKAHDVESSVTRAAQVFDGYKFDIKSLPKISPEQVEAKLYDEEDFISADSDGRVPVKVKLGSILIDFVPKGKGSYNLDVYEIDFANHRLNKILHMNERRYVNMRFDSIIPFELSANYSNMTQACSNIADYKEAKIDYADSYEMKKRIIQGALQGKPQPRHQSRRPIAIQSTSAGSGVTFFSLLSDLRNLLPGGSNSQQSSNQPKKPGNKNT